MKKMLLLLIICCLYSASAQPPDSCLKLVAPNDFDPETSLGIMNPDSVRVDSCEWSPTYCKLYAKSFFEMSLPSNYYPFDPIPGWDDTLTVNDISNNYSDFKQAFQQLESQLGSIYFRKGTPGIWQIGDSAIIESPWIIIFFEDYQNIEYVTDLLHNSIDSSIRVIYHVSVLGLCSIPYDDNLKAFTKIRLSPNPVEDRLTIKVPDEIKNQKIIIYNSPGIEVLRIPYQEQINVIGLPSGVYYLRIGEHVTKFIKM